MFFSTVQRWRNPSDLWSHSSPIKKKIFIYLFGLYEVLVAARGVFSSHLQDFSVAACGGLVPWPGMEPRSSALEAWIPSHLTTREVSTPDFVNSPMRMRLRMSLDPPWASTVPPPPGPHLPRNPLEPGWAGQVSWDRSLLVTSHICEDFSQRLDGEFERTG